MSRKLVQHTLSDIHLFGYSVAGEEAVIAAPELNVCFDVGKAPAAILPIDHILLSHGHMDHAAGLAYYFSQRNFIGNEDGTVLAPKALVTPIRSLLKAWGELEGHVSPARIIGMEPGDEFQVRRGLLVRSFQNNHGVPSLGYSVIEVRKKLRPEFSTKTGPELVELKKSGVAIEHAIEIPLIAYCGDTAEGSWLDHDFVKQAKVFIIECTFFEPDHVRRARAGYHLHVKDVARIVEKLENEHIVVSHITRRTPVREAKRTLSRMVSPETLSRITFLMEGRRFRPQRGAPEAPTGGD